MVMSGIAVGCGLLATPFGPRNFAFRNKNRLVLIGSWLAQRDLSGFVLKAKRR
jgi:hypothetical protein